MDHGFWEERWQRGEIGFHQPHIHAQLQKFWPGLGLGKGSTVFVPLAGKSRDMAWLAERGHMVIGAELSETAVQAFFDESSLTPTVRSSGAFQIFESGPYKIYQGDFFELTAESLREVAACYDRAALIALPPAMRTQYARTLATLLPGEVQILTISIEYPEGEIKGPPFSVPAGEVKALFSDEFEISILEERDALAASDNLKQRGVTKLSETAYLLRRHA